MKYIVRTGRTFYAIAIIVYGIQQFVYSNFRDVFFPPWQTSLPLLTVWAYIFGVYLIASGFAIITGKKGYIAALLLGGIFLLLDVVFQLPYQFISEPNKLYHLGLWESVLKESALAGGAFVVASSFLKSNDFILSNKILKVLNRLQPYGSIFFSFTILSFGICHFLYPQGMADMVPCWFHDHAFWAYFGGVALITSACCIILNIRMRAVALLLSIMLFLWFLILHLPNAVKYPDVMRGNSISSTSDALAFSGIALLIAFTLKGQKWINDLEKIKIDY